jgi:hypothetical protein
MATPAATLRQLQLRILPSLIRGVTPTDTSSPVSSLRLAHSLDWLTYTIPATVGWGRAFPESDTLWLTGEVLPNFKGYDTRLALTYGSVSFHTRYPHHKICVQFGGRDLRLLVEAGVDPQSLLAYALEYEAKVTRLDFALDVFGPSSPKELYEAWEEKTLKTPARSCKFLLTAERAKGETIKSYSTYIGKTDSNRWLRCYDKAAQLKAEGPWTRLEMVARDEVGTRLATAMLTNDLGSAGKQAIRDFVQCDIDWFNQAVTGPSVYIAASSRKDRNTREWLKNTILPTLQRVIAEDAAVGDVTIREAFLSELLQRPS